jgi:uncharacterized protein (TIGR02246 family)
MSQDEQEIRKLVTDWMTATQAGDVDAVLNLMAEDVIFLVPGKLPMRKADFAAAAAAQAGPASPQFDGRTEIQEIRVLGDWAFMWTKLKVVVTPPDESGAITRSGHTLSVLKKENGKWVIARDANLLVRDP